MVAPLLANVVTFYKRSTGKAKLIENVTRWAPFSSRNRRNTNMRMRMWPAAVPLWKTFQRPWYTCVFCYNAWVINITNVTCIGLGTAYTLLECIYMYKHVYMSQTELSAVPSMYTCTCTVTCSYIHVHVYTCI